MKRKDVLKLFGERVREERKEHGWSQEIFAEKVGCHRTYIGMIERGEKNITLWNIYKLAKALKMPVPALMSGLL